MISRPKVLIATDGSEHARSASEVVQSLPLPDDLAVTVMVVTPASGEDEHAAIVGEAERIVANEADKLAQRGWQTTRLVKEGDAAEQIVVTAETLNADIISIGSHGATGITRFLLGGIAQKVLHHAPCSVLIGRLRDDKTRGRKPLRILLAVDGSEPAKEAIDLVSTWRMQDRAEVIVVGVLAVATTLYGMDVVERTSPSWVRRKDELHGLLEAAEGRVRESGAETSVILREGGPDPSHEILETADSEDIDLIVVGHTGRSGAIRFLLGSVAHRIANHAKCSVLVVRPRDEASGNN